MNEEVGRRWSAYPVTCLQRVRANALVFVIAVITLAVALFASSFNQYLFGLVAIYAMSAIGLDLVMYRAGQVSLANGALMAVGAYVTAVTCQWSWAPFPLPIVLSGLAGCFVGVLVALGSGRLRGMYFALVTLALQFVIVFLAQQYELSSGQVYGLFVPSPSIGGLSFTYGPSYTLFLGSSLIVVVVVVVRLYRGYPGRMWRAIREDEVAATTMQVATGRWKGIAFAVSSSLIAVSGSLLAYYTGNVSSGTFTLLFAVSFVVMVVVGGSGTISGAIAGAAIVTLLPQALQKVAGGVSADPWLATRLPVIEGGLFGLILLLVLLYLRQGVVPGVESLVARLRRGRRGPRVAVEQTPEPASDRRAHLLEEGSSPADRHSSLVPLLRVSDVSVKYKTGAVGLSGLDLVVPEGRVTAVVGRNGAGKTSLLRSVSGFLPAERVTRSGSIQFDQHELINSSPLSTARLGIILVPERDKVFPGLTVAEHVTRLGNAETVKEKLPEVWTALERRWRSPAGLLSGGERQMLAIAVAVSLEPRLMLIDEMSLGLAPVMIRRMADVISEIRSNAVVTVLLVEQNVALASEVADIVLEMSNGNTLLPVLERPVP